MATGSSTGVRKRSTSTGGPDKKKRLTSILCSLCQDAIDSNNGSVEVKVCLPSGYKQHSVRWSKNGEAIFHSHCWNDLLKNARMRNTKKCTIQLSLQEKSLIKEANKTAEYHDSEATITDGSSAIVELINNANYCVAFTGAGISTSAGIGDYRGKEGKWTEEDRHDDTTIDSTDDGVPYEELRPTLTHNALTELVKRDIVKHVITQNGDGLHNLSGIPNDKLSELHGNVFMEKCEKCNHQYYRSFYVLDDEASEYYEEVNDTGTTQLTKPTHAVQCPQCCLCHRTGRKCEQHDCHGYLKDSIINFSDNLDQAVLEKAEVEASKADLILSLGTTMQVMPACDLVLMGPSPLRLIIINRQKTGFDHYCKEKQNGKEMGVRIYGDCDRIMEKVMEYINKKNK